MSTQERSSLTSHQREVETETRTITGEDITSINKHPHLAEEQGDSIQAKRPSKLKNLSR